MSKTRRTIGNLIQTALKEIDPTYLALGYLRYEALRKLSPHQYDDLHKRNLRGEWFDEMVDELISKEANRD